MSLTVPRLHSGSLLARAIESDSSYFEMGAESRRLEGASLSWMPDLAGSPGAAVIHRVDPDTVADGGSRWLANAEMAMSHVGATLSRIYLDCRHGHADALLSGSGYQARDELVFLDALPDPSIELILRRVETDADWERKLRFHAAADETPDGHANAAAGWVELERRKSRAGMTSFLAELDGEVVGAVGAIWLDQFVRTKNLVVAPGRRRRGIAKAILGRIAQLGRERDLSEQCVLAVRGDGGEQLYRALGMTMIGYQVEWSKPLSVTER